MADVEHVKSVMDTPTVYQPDVVPVIHGAFTLYPTGLVVRGEPTFQEWAEVGHVLKTMEQGIAFLVGDWLRYGEEHYRELAYQIIDARDWSPDTVRNYTWVSSRVPIENRVIGRGLHFGHYQAVAALPPAEQNRWLRQATAGDDEYEVWSVTRLRRAIKEDGDPAPTGWYVLVTLDNEYDQKYVMKELQEKGYRVKAVTKRRS